MAQIHLLPLGAVGDLNWPVEYDHDERLITTEFMLWDECAPVGRVSRHHDPLGRGPWRWSMFVGAPQLFEPRGLRRAGATFSCEKARVECEKAYSRLLAHDPNNRSAIQRHVAAIEARARAWQLGDVELAAAA